VPTLVVPAGAAPECDLVPGEREVGGVVVGGGELVLHRDVRDERRQGVDRGQRGVLVDLELALDLDGLVDRHGPVVSVKDEHRQ
jgi:hypothetical protein